MESPWLWFSQGRMFMIAKSTIGAGVHLLFPVPTLVFWNRMAVRIKHTISLRVERRWPRSAISCTFLTEAWERKAKSVIPRGVGLSKERVAGSTYFER